MWLYVLWDMNTNLDKNINFFIITNNINITIIINIDIINRFEMRGLSSNDTGDWSIKMQAVSGKIKIKIAGCFG